MSLNRPRYKGPGALYLGHLESLILFWRGKSYSLPVAPVSSIEPERKTSLQQYHTLMLTALVTHACDALVLSFFSRRGLALPCPCIELTQGMHCCLGRMAMLYRWSVKDWNISTTAKYLETKVKPFSNRNFRVVLSTGFVTPPPSLICQNNWGAAKSLRTARPAKLVRLVVQWVTLTLLL